MKRSPADSWFSKCVRLRSRYTCEKCGAQHDASSTGLHCSHIFSRRHRTIRWCGDNAQSLCHHCHSWYGGNPADSGKWLVDLLGEGYLDMLREKREMKLKIPKSEEKEIAKHYRNEFKRMSEIAETHTGRVEMESYQ